MINMSFLDSSLRFMRDSPFLPIAHLTKSLIAFDQLRIEMPALSSRCLNALDHVALAYHDDRMTQNRPAIA